MRLQKLASLTGFLLLLNYQLVASAVDKGDYFSKSILRDLEEKKGSFASDIELVDVASKTVNHVEEKYSFREKIGAYVGTEKFEGSDPKSRFTAKLIYMNDVNEIYQVDKERKKCGPQDLDSIIKYFWTTWAPKEVFGDDTNKYYIIGPNVLLTVLLHNEKDATECKSDDEKMVCFQLEFGKRVQLKYYFEKDSRHTMYPEKILILEKDEQDSWKLTRQMNYFRFVASFSETPIVNANLPIGYGCTRVKSEQKSYPQVKTNYGTRFELEFEAVFRYVETENNKFIPSPGFLYLDSFDDIEDDTPANIRPAAEEGDAKKPKNYYTRIYFNKMLHDEAISVNVLEGPIEIDNGTTRTVYDFNSNVLYSILLDDEKCVPYHLAREHNINYFYLQDLFVNYPQFFEADEKWEYIGEYNVRNMPCLVFEKKFDDYNRKIELGDSKNDAILKFFHENKNDVFSNHATVTHYYPKVEEFWGHSTSEHSVPMKIEIRLFSDEERTDEIAKQTINVASWKPGSTRVDVFDLSNCVKHAYDYNWVLVKFDDTTDAVKKFKKYEGLIKNSFRQTLDLSPLRIGEILVDSDESSIYVTFKLLEVTEVEAYFHSKPDTTIEGAQDDEFADNEELCARQCLNNPNCAAYAYCGDLDCKLAIDSDFDLNFDPSQPLGKEWDWSKIKTKEEKDCSYHQRFVKFDEKLHASNKEILKTLDSRINSQENPLELYLVNLNSEVDIFKADDIKVNVQPGRHTKSSSKLDDEKFDEERNQIKYNDLFYIVESGRAFNQEKLKDNEEDDKKEKKQKLIASTRDLTLAECQLMCINNDNCQSMSYCKGSQECILSTLEPTEIKEEVLVNSHKCATSSKKFLAQYHKHSKRSLTQNAQKVIRETVGLTEEDCAAFCSNDKDCQSFDYCEGEEEGKKHDAEGKTLACYLHNIHPNDDKTDDKNKPQWGTQGHCDHYTYKHSLEFNEHSTVKLKDEGPFIGEHSKISLDNCASLCTESEICNTFDYCITQDKSGKGHISSLSCRLSTNVYSSEKVVEKQFECSTYSILKPRVITKTIKKSVDKPVHGGWVSFLSLLSLAVGGAVGAGAAMYVIKNYFSPY